MNPHGCIEKTTQTDQTKSKIISVCLFILKNGEFDDVSYRVVKQTGMEECVVITYDHLFGILGENIDPLSISLSHLGTCKIFILFRPVKSYNLVKNGLFDTVHFLNILRHFHKQATFCPGISIKFLQSDTHPSAIAHYTHPFPRCQSVDCPVYGEKSDGKLDCGTCFPCNACSLLMVKTSDKKDCVQDIDLPNDTVPHFASKEHDVSNQRNTDSSQPSLSEDSSFDNNDDYDDELVVEKICSFNKRNHGRSLLRENLSIVSMVPMKHPHRERKLASVGGETISNYVKTNNFDTDLSYVNQTNWQEYPSVQLDNMLKISICEASNQTGKVTETNAVELEDDSINVSEINKEKDSGRTCSRMKKSHVTSDHPNTVSVESNNRLHRSNRREVSPYHGQIVEPSSNSGMQKNDTTQNMLSQESTHSRRQCDLKHSALHIPNTSDCSMERVKNFPSGMKKMPSATLSVGSVLASKSSSVAKQNVILRASLQGRTIKNKKPSMVNATLRLDDVIAQLKKSVSKPQLSVLNPQLDRVQCTSQETRIESVPGQVSDEESEVNKSKERKWLKRKRKPSEKVIEYLESLKCKSNEREVLSKIAKKRTGKTIHSKSNSVAVEIESSFQPDPLEYRKTSRINNKTGSVSDQKNVTGASNKHISSCSEPNINASEMLQKSQNSRPLKLSHTKTEKATKTTKRECIKHIQTNHSIDKSMVNDDDDDRTDTEPLLKTTVKGEEKHKPIQCPVCHEFYSNERTLGRHMRIHNLVRPYKCPVCKKSFVQKITMKVHMRLHSGEKPHQCIICGRSFAQKSNMETHVRRHLGVRPYQCDLCSKGFSDKGSLGEHKKIHTGEQPYVCTVCGKSFSQRANMRTHLHRHRAEKTYSCLKCKESFNNKECLLKHTKNHINTSEQGIVTREIADQHTHATT
ncbi:uncharacterized protein [Haliotis cracherodii]|uniref:uncharacterized protein n=1 Tax=Haliotis cracherodii TaxID=6455 RepID=UPI0039EAC3FE